jgi:hypothetical protein
MDPSWIDDAEAFITYIRNVIGPKPDKSYSLDRINNDKGYFPGNLRWASQKEQIRNSTSVKVWLTYNGKTQLIPDWAEELNIPKQAIYMRKAKGWSDEKALSTPLKKCKQRRS